MGLISEKPKFDLSDISIVPSEISSIEHRSECNPFIEDENGWLPLFTAPMSSVINEKNINYFIENRINPILPRTESLETRLEYSKEYFCSFGLDEFINTFIPEDKNEEITALKEKHYILIDIANGHMKKLITIIQWCKYFHEDQIVLMVGNIANPETYRLLSEAGVDYVRCSIGSGNGCLTAVQTGIYYPNGSLISECKELKTNYNLKAKIIADGGMKSYSDIIKALAIGADYVMLGSILNKALESAGETISGEDLGIISDVIFHKDKKVNQYSKETLILFKAGYNFYKEFYGMSTKKAQVEMGNTSLKTSEGVIRRVQVEYTLSGWVSNFISYMRTTMSYTGKKTLEDFIGNVDYVLLTNNTTNRIDK